MYKFQNIISTVVSFRNGTHGSWYLLVEYRKELAKKQQKVKKRQLPMTDISDFKVFKEYAKIFLMKFC